MFYSECKMMKIRKDILPLFKPVIDYEEVKEEYTVVDRGGYDYSSRDITDVLNDESIISGSKWAFEIFFERR